MISGGAEFYGLGSEPDPGPREFIKAHGPRKFHVQGTFEGEDSPAGATRLSYRAYEMGRQAERATAWLLEQEKAGVKIQWHTLTFSINRSGMEGAPETELWRWEVWGE